MVGLTASGALGVIGLIIDPAAAPVLWTVLLGTCVGGVFPLVLTVISLRTATPADTASLSAMAQSLGYLLGCCGPFLFGLIRGFTGSWRPSLILLLVVLMVQSVLGWFAGRPRTV
jgi:CP family cyanate transporter-like MFS transporter